MPLKVAEDRARLAYSKDPNVVHPGGYPDDYPVPTLAKNDDVICDLLGSNPKSEAVAAQFDLGAMKGNMQALPCSNDQQTGKKVFDDVAQIENARIDRVENGNTKALSSLSEIMSGANADALPNLKTVVEGAKAQEEMAGAAIEDKKEFYSKLIEIVDREEKVITRMKGEYNAAVNYQAQPDYRQIAGQVQLDESTGVFQSVAQPKVNAVLGAESMRVNACKFSKILLTAKGKDPQFGERKKAAIESIKAHIAAYAITKIQSARKRLLIAEAYVEGYKRGLQMCQAGMQQSIAYANSGVDWSTGTLQSLRPPASGD